MDFFRGKVAVVTGAGSGMGRALAQELARRGARLALSDVDATGLAATAAGCGSAQVRTDHLDVAERDAVYAYAQTVAEHFGVVNLVFNNAGIAYAGDVEVTGYKDLERVMDVDFWGVVHGTKAFLPHLIASGDGHVVNTSSVFGLFSVPGQSAYNAAKFAVRGFTEALRQEMLVAHRPVRVSCVHPGGVRTAIARNATTAAGLDQPSLARTFDEKLARMSPHDAARVILRGVERGDARILVGWDAKVLDIVVRATGSGYQRLVARAATRAMRPTPSGRVSSTGQAARPRYARRSAGS